MKLCIFVYAQTSRQLLTSLYTRLRIYVDSDNPYQLTDQCIYINFTFFTL